ncbi:response regulator [Neolewinella persica]|uniref:response regulator n=1 Tax=Neolewinella persica TaxID=70998 RepID=UPI00037B4111|nr:response regulator transcription factor [Neolewinella persica]
MSKIRTAIIEDDHDIRPALRLLINGTDGYECLTACCSVEEGLSKLLLDQIDVLILDIHLPGMNGVEAASIFKKRRPELLILMFTVYADDDHVFDALRAGADGYVLKRSSPAQLLKHIEELFHGGAPMSPQIARRIVQAFKSSGSPGSDAESAALAAAGLTPREREVLDQLAEGYLYKEIARHLNIGIDTVKRHITHIYQKLHVQNRTEALNKAFPRK